jgi:hypothetical protein
MTFTLWTPRNKAWPDARIAPSEADLAAQRTELLAALL